MRKARPFHRTPTFADAAGGIPRYGSRLHLAGDPARVRNSISKKRLASKGISRQTARGEPTLWAVAECISQFFNPSVWLPAASLGRSDRFTQLRFGLLREPRRQFARRKI
jgi:hypothetical protein